MFVRMEISSGKSISTSYLNVTHSSANEFRSATVHKTGRIFKNSMRWVLLSGDVPTVDAVEFQKSMSGKKVRNDFPSPASLARNSCLSKNPYFISIHRGVIGIRSVCKWQSLRKTIFEQ
jgi:hypothetical protein